MFNEAKDTAQTICLSCVQEMWKMKTSETFLSHSHSPSKKPSVTNDQSAMQNSVMNPSNNVICILWLCGFVGESFVLVTHFAHKFGPNWRQRWECVCVEVSATVQTQPQLAQRLHVKCDTALGSALRHSFSVCGHYIVCMFVSAHFFQGVYVCVGWGVRPPFLPGRLRQLSLGMSAGVSQSCCRAWVSRGCCLQCPQRRILSAFDSSGTCHANHGGSVPVQRHWGEDCEGQPHERDRSD